MRDKQANKVLNIHIYLYYIQRKQILPANFHPKYKLTKILSLNAGRNRHILDTLNAEAAKKTQRVLCQGQICLESTESQRRRDFLLINLATFVSYNFLD